MSNAPGDKQIKFTFTVDQRSVEVARSAIRQLTAEIKTLVETMQKAGSGGLLGSVSGQRGGINPQQQQTVKAVGVAGGLGQAVTQEAQNLLRMSRAGTDGLRQMTSALRLNFGEQAREIDRLAQSWTKLAQAQGSAGWKGFMGQGLGSGGGVGWAAMGGPPPMPMTAGTRANLANAWLAGGIQGPPPPPVNLQTANARTPWMSYGGVGSLSPMGILNAVLAGGAIGAGYNMATQAVASSRLGTAEMDVDVGVGRIQQASGVNQALGGFGLRLLRDRGLRRAYAGVTATDLRSYMGDERRALLVERIQQRLGQTGGLGQAGGQLKDYLGGLANAGLEAALSGGGEADVYKAMAAQHQRLGVGALDEAKVAAAQREIAIEMAKAPGEIAEQRRQRMSVFDQNLLAQYDPRARLAMQHAYSTADAQKLGLGTPFSEGEVGAMRVMFGQTAGRAFMGTGQRYTSMYLGGVGNIAQIYGAGAQYGGGGPLTAALQRGIGAGGVDVAAGNQLGGLAAGALFRGGEQFGPGGAATMLESMLNIAGGGGPGEQMRLARLAESGYGALGNIMGGGVDNYQKAVNQLAAIQAAPGMDVQALAALQQVGPEAMLAMLKSGKVSESLASRGFTIGDVRRYNAAQQEFAFSRYIGTGEYGDVGRAAAGAQQAGGAEAYIRSLGGLQLGQKEIRRQARLLGTALKDQGVVGTEGAGELAILAQLEAAGLITGTRGRGAHASHRRDDAAAKGQDDVIKRAEEDRTRELAKGEGVKGRGERDLEAQRRMDRAGVAGGGAEVSLAGATKSVDAFRTALDKVTVVLERVGTGRVRTGH